MILEHLSINFKINNFINFNNFKWYHKIDEKSKKNQNSKKKMMYTSRKKNDMKENSHKSMKMFIHQKIIIKSLVKK